MNAAHPIEAGTRENAERLRADCKLCVVRAVEKGWIPPLSHDSLPRSAFFSLLFLIWSDVLGVPKGVCVTAHSFFLSRFLCRLLWRRHAPASGNCPGAYVRGEKLASTSNSHVHSHTCTHVHTSVHVAFFTLLIATPVPLSLRPCVYACASSPLLFTLVLLLFLLPSPPPPSLALLAIFTLLWRRLRRLWRIMLFIFFFLPRRRRTRTRAFPFPIHQLPSHLISSWGGGEILTLPVMPRAQWTGNSYCVDHFSCTLARESTHGNASVGRALLFDLRLVTSAP